MEAKGKIQFFFLSCHIPLFDSHKLQASTWSDIEHHFEEDLLLLA